jgi:hypothetical protein
MSEPNTLSRRFDDMVQLYDEVWPRYPEERIEHIIAFAALPCISWAPGLLGLRLFLRVHWHHRQSINKYILKY